MDDDGGEMERVRVLMEEHGGEMDGEEENESNEYREPIEEDETDEEEQQFDISLAASHSVSIQLSKVITIYCAQCLLVL